MIRDNMNSDENDSYSANENNEYMEHVADHVDEHLESYHPKKPSPNETFYKSLEEREHRTNIRKEWVIPGSVDYTFQNIPTKISSTSNHALYKSALFMNKEKLKMSLGMLALKEKFEYRIRRLSKTRF